VTAKLSLRVFYTRYRLDDVHDGDVPRDNVTEENTEFDSAREAADWLIREGATEWSSEPPRWGHGWFSYPDALEVWGGDQYDPGYDREEISASLSGKGSFMAWAIVTQGIQVDRERSNPVMGVIREAYDLDDIDGSIERALTAMSRVIAKKESPLSLVYDMDFVASMLAGAMALRTVTVEQVILAERILLRLKYQRAGKTFPVLEMAS
jgi:hypothetical protein